MPLASSSRTIQQAIAGGLGMCWAHSWPSWSHRSNIETAEGANLLQVAGGTSGDLSVTEDDLLGSAPAQSAHDAREDLLLADEGGVLAGHKPCQTARLASGDQGDLRSILCQTLPSVQDASLWPRACMSRTCLRYSDSRLDINTQTFKYNNEPSYGPQTVLL